MAPMIKVKSSRPPSSKSASPSLAQSLTQSLGISDHTRRKIAESFKLLSVAFPPIAAVIVLSIMMILQVDRTLRFSGNMNEFLAQGQLLSRLVNVLQKERGMTCLLISSASDQLRNQLNSYKYDTDEVLQEFTPSLWQNVVQGSNLPDMQSLDVFIGSLNDHRNAALKSQDCVENLNYYSPRINIIIYNTARVFYNTDEGKFWGTFDALRMVLQAEEMYGLKRAIGGTFFSQGYFTSDMLRYFLGISGAAEMYLEQAGNADSDVKVVLIKQQILLNQTLSFIEDMMLDILQNRSSGDNQQLSLTWFRNISDISSTVVIPARNLLTSKLTDYLTSSLTTARSALYVAIAIVATSLGICIPITLYYSVQARKMEAKVREKIRELGVEKSKSENLLFQMLPKEIVRELQAGRQVVPQMYRECTLYFSDIVGFTTICSTATPFEVVDLLNRLYTAMDTILDQYNVYKVETIGDAYMVVSGIPTSNGFEHSNQIATMALHMLKEISTMTVLSRMDEKLRMRIGCNTGSCAAGVVGLKMPRYCLFGDTVNTASRMESTGLAMRIQITESTRNHLRAYHKKQGYVTVERGETTVKGKGCMKTYWLKSKERFPYECDLSLPDPAFPKECLPAEEDHQLN